MRIESRELDRAVEALEKARYACEDIDQERIAVIEQNDELEGENDELREELEEVKEQNEELRAQLAAISNDQLITRLEKLEGIIRGMRMELEDARLEVVERNIDERTVIIASDEKTADVIENLIAEERA